MLVHRERRHKTKQDGKKKHRGSCVLDQAPCVGTLDIPVVVVVGVVAVGQGRFLWHWWRNAKEGDSLAGEKGRKTSGVG